jgi:hypothetical protein
VRTWLKREVGSRGKWEAEEVGILFYFDIFNHYSINEPGETFFLNLALFSHASLSDVTYK